MQALLTLFHLALAALLSLAAMMTMYALLLLMIKACLMAVHHSDMRPRNRYYKMEVKL